MTVRGSRVSPLPEPPVPGREPTSVHNGVSHVLSNRGRTDPSSARAEVIYWTTSARQGTPFFRHVQGDSSEQKTARRNRRRPAPTPTSPGRRFYGRAT